MLDAREFKAKVFIPSFNVLEVYFPLIVSKKDVLQVLG